MKKLALVTVIASCLSFPAMLQASPFSGTYGGLEVSSNKLKLDDYGVSVSGKQKTSWGLIAGVGADFGDSGLVGILEGKYKFGGSKISESDANTSAEIEEKSQFSISYLQGYNIADIALPYVKIGYAFGSYDAKASATNLYSSYSISGTESGHGLELGGGVKFALYKNFKVGIDYAHQNIKIDEVKFKNSQVSLNFAYSF